MSVPLAALTGIFTAALAVFLAWLLLFYVGNEPAPAGVCRQHCNAGYHCHKCHAGATH